MELKVFRGTWPMIWAVGTYHGRQLCCRRSVLLKQNASHRGRHILCYVRHAVKSTGYVLFTFHWCLHPHLRPRLHAAALCEPGLLHAQLCPLPSCNMVKNLCVSGCSLAVSVHYEACMHPNCYMQHFIGVLLVEDGLTMGGCVDVSTHSVTWFMQWLSSTRS